MYICGDVCAIAEMKPLYPHLLCGTGRQKVADVCRKNECMNRCLLICLEIDMDGYLRLKLSGKTMEFIGYAGVIAEIQQKFCRNI